MRIYANTQNTQLCPNTSDYFFTNSTSYFSQNASVLTYNAVLAEYMPSSCVLPDCLCVHHKPCYSAYCIETRWIEIGFGM